MLVAALLSGSKQPISATFHDVSGVAIAPLGPAGPGGPGGPRGPMGPIDRSLAIAPATACSIMAAK